jgi:hypothetical protein
MIDRKTIIKAFTDNFVLKEKRERCYWELTNPNKRYMFADRLNHKWATILNIKYLIQVKKELDFAEGIQSLLKFEDEEVCYVISNYGSFDDQLVTFKKVFDKIYCCGFGTLLINTAADTLYLETEHIKGSSDRFIGYKTGK